MHSHYGVPCSCKRKSVVGIVFVPGIMGSRLFNRQESEVVWDPAVGMGDHPTGWLLEKLEQQNQNRKLRLKYLVDYKSKSRSANSSKTIGERTKEYLEVADKQKYHVSAVAREQEAQWQKSRKGEFLWNILSLAFKDAKGRKEMLVHKNASSLVRDDELLSVDQGTDEYFKIHTSVKPSRIVQRRQQGWGEVSWGSYGKFLSWLDSWISSELGYQFYNWSFATYAVGYNWMQSNRKSGQRLKTRIDEIRQELAVEHQVEPANVKIIVISHSMGGFVARSAAVLENADIDTVIHGAMPTDGSPATYVNARSGYGMPAGVALGMNAAEVTAILGFCQGGLELLPNQHYRDAKGNSDWLKIEVEGQETLSINKDFPGEKIYDFYKDLSQWYSLIQPELLVPRSRVSIKNLVKHHRKRIDSTEKFHLDLSDYYHFNTRLLYGVNENMPSYDQCVWSAQQSPKGKPYEWKIVADQNYGFSFGEGEISLADSQSIKDYQQRLKNADRSAIFDEGKRLQIMRAVGPLNSHIFQIKPASAPGDATVHSGAGTHPNLLNSHKFPMKLDQEHQLFFDSDDVMVKVSELLWQQADRFDKESKGL
ncbi:esterase/lipase family protein [Pelagibaculum spongiae]|nr:hypothetical protein [Pelagibaculum spongiae]